MGDSNINVISSFLLIAIIIGVGIMLGNSAMAGEKTEIYYDFNNFDLANNTDIDVVTNDNNAYNSLMVEGNFTLNNTIKQIIDFEQNLSGVNEYIIDIQIDFTGLNDTLTEGIWFGWSMESKTFENNISDLNYANIDSEGISFNRFRSTLTAEELSLEIAGALNFDREALSAGIYTAKYTINTDSMYMLETATYDFVDSTKTDLEGTSFTMLSDYFSNPINLGSNGNFAFLIENQGNGQDNVLTENVSYSIDYIKLSYNEVVVE